MATVWVVDDNADILRFIGRVLGPEHTVIAAESGVEALTIFESYAEQVHLVLTDIMMPGMSGLELVERIEEMHQRRMPVVFISGASDFPVDPCRVVLKKPFSPTDLKETVRRVLIDCRPCRGRP